MSKMILITGGARSGKSSLAEEKAKAFGENVLYIATAKPIDDEMKQRIAKHRKQRPAQWETFEGYRDLDTALADIIQNRDAVLLDCATIMVTNLMLDESFDWNNITRGQVETIESNIQSQVRKLIDLSKGTDVPFIIVTNELGMGVVPPSAMGRDFRDIAGRVNQILVKNADEVYFCVSGIPMRIK